MQQVILARGVVAYGNSGGTNAATMSFHRPGSYAINMGLDTDNVFRVGGWSDGASVHRFQASTSAFYTNGGLYPNNGSNYLRSVTGSYCGLEIVGTNGGYGGISFNTSCSGTHLMFDAAGNGGLYDTTNGWTMYYNRSTTCWGIGGSTTASGYKGYTNGSHYVAGDLYATGACQ